MPERGYATVGCLSVRLSVCDVELPCSHRLEYFENTSRLDSLRYILWLTPTSAIWSNGNTPHILFFSCSY